MNPSMPIASAIGADQLADRDSFLIYVPGGHFQPRSALRAITPIGIFRTVPLAYYRRAAIFHFISSSPQTAYSSKVERRRIGSWAAALRRGKRSR